MVKDDYTSWLERWNPYRESGPELHRRGRLVLLVSLIVSCIAGFYSAVYVALGVWPAAVASGVASLGGALTLLTFPRHGRIRLAGHGMVAGCLVGMAVVIWIDGGSRSMAMAWLAMLPMFAAMLAGRRAGLVWSIVSVMAIEAVFALESMGVTATRRIPPELASVYALLMLLGLVVTVMALLWSSERAREAAMSRLDQATRSAEEARDEALRAHVAARGVLDHVDQGLVIVDRDGSLQPARSAALDRWFERGQAPRHVWELLAATDAQIADAVEAGWEQLRADVLPVDVALDQLPKRLLAADRRLELRWVEAGAGQVLLVVTDTTEQEAAERERAAREELTAVITRLARDPRGFAEFLADGRCTVNALRSGLGTLEDERRMLHTLKGNAAVMGVARLARWLHEIETDMGERGGRCTHAQRAELEARFESLEGQIGPLMDSRDDAAVTVSAAELERTVQLLESGVPRPAIGARMRAWTWDTTEARLEQLADQARRLARDLGKQIEAVVDCDVDMRTPADPAWTALWSAMVHLVRNAVDHGIEADRAAGGKPEVGTIRLRARRIEGAVLVEVADDGAGIDWSRLQRMAAERGAAFSTHAQRVSFLLSDGTTTRGAANEWSGRGLGTAAVRAAVARLRGQLDVLSTPGQDTRFWITVPLPGAAKPSAGLRRAS